MPPRIMHQNREIKELFRQKIKDKVAKEKLNMQQRIDEELPSWITWVMKPLANIAFDQRHRHDNEKGEGGENRAFINFWLFLPKEWVLINDVVLEPEHEEFIQIDHLLIGPPGIFIVETKAWDGAFSGYKDYWKRKEGNTWVKCESPTRQNLRHWKLLNKWLMDNLNCQIPLEFKNILYPVVLFTRAKWLKTNECSMPVFDSGLALSIYIRRHAKTSILNSEQIEAIATSIVDAKPCPDKLQEFTDIISLPSNNTQNNATICTQRSKPKIKTGRSKDGRSYVKIFDSKEAAEKIRASYKKEGHKTGSLKPDHFTKGTWYFYYD